MLQIQAIDSVEFMTNSVFETQDIPLFYKLFNTSSDNNRKDRHWILRLLGTSLHTFDVGLYVYSVITIEPDINRTACNRIIEFTNADMSTILSRHFLTPS
jgi:hypothetical protein